MHVNGSTNAQNAKSFSSQKREIAVSFALMGRFHVHLYKLMVRAVVARNSQHLLN